MSFYGVKWADSETLASYLTPVARFHNYSFGDIVAIARQKPTATRVHGFRTWKEMGRFVKHGEKAFQSPAPVSGSRRKETIEQRPEGKPGPVLIGVRSRLRRYADPASAYFCNRMVTLLCSSGCGCAVDVPEN